MMQACTHAVAIHKMRLSKVAAPGSAMSSGSLGVVCFMNVDPDV